MTTDHETALALTIFRALDQKDQDFLLDLAEALQQSQEGCDDSLKSAPKMS